MHECICFVTFCRSQITSSGGGAVYASHIASYPGHVFGDTDTELHAEGSPCPKPKDNEYKLFISVAAHLGFIFLS